MLPSAPRDARRRHSTVEERDPSELAPRVERVLDRDLPGVTVGRGACDAQVASQLDEDAVRAPCDHLGRDDVAGEALADPARIDPHAMREGHRADDPIELDPPATRGRVGCTVFGGSGIRLLPRGLPPDSASLEGEPLEGAVVAERGDRSADRRVVQPARRRPPANRALDEREGLVGDHDRPPGQVAELVQLALRPEPAPAALQILYAVPGGSDEGRRTTYENQAG